MRRVCVDDVVTRLKERGVALELRGDPDTVLDSVVAWPLFAGTGLTFQTGPDAAKLEAWRDPRAGLIICSSALAATLGEGPFLLVDQPRTAFVYAAQLFEEPRPPAAIHPSAVVHPEARIGRDVAIGPNCVIGRCVIGAGTRIGALVYVGDDVVVGRNVRIDNGAHLGSDGIGVVRDAAGKLVAFPHFSTLVVEDDVWIWSGAELHRGVLLPTTVGRGTHIGSRSEIGHNATVGRDVLIASGVIIGGSARIGDQAYVGCGAFVSNGVEVAEKVYVGAHAAVMKSCLDAGVTIAAPASRNLGKLLGPSA